MGTWIYDGGDLAAVVRGGTFVRESANITSSINGSFINDDMLSRCRFSMENYGEGICFSARADSTFSSTKGPKPQNSDQGSDKITPFTITNTKLEPAGSAQNKLGIESPATVSSPPAAPLYLKSPPTSPTKTAATLNNSAQKEVVESSSSAIKAESNTHSLTKLSGAKRRKSQQRRIMCVPAVAGSWNKQGGTGVPSDLWAWRKYGQKPIKGSPYPRGYYRCSSSKGCPARKQIERSHTDPTMLVITYTAEHNHSWPTQRSALTRSSRQNAFHDKVQPLSEPRHSVSNIKLDLSAARSPAKRSSDNICSVDESAKHSRQKPGGLFNHFHTNGVENEDRDGYANLDVMLSANHMHDHDLFADLGELPQLYPKDLTVHSDHEEAATTVPADPFNLFNWSSATNITAE